MSGEDARISAFQQRSESFRHADFTVDVTLPRSSEDLIDEAEFGADERLPYWAELWPSARGLARLLLEMPDVPRTALELGCGLALPSLALLHRGVDVLATDYYEDALAFARHNAAANGLRPLPTRLLDWRSPPPDLQRFPLVVAADVLYEARNGAALESLLPAILAEGGEVLVADPGRVHCEPFLERMAGLGWTIDRLAECEEPASAGSDHMVRVRLIRMRRG